MRLHYFSSSQNHREPYAGKVEDRNSDFILIWSVPKVLYSKLTMLLVYRAGCFTWVMLIFFLWRQLSTILISFLKVHLHIIIFRFFVVLLFVCLFSVFCFFFLYIVIWFDEISYILFLFFFAFKTDIFPQVVFKIEIQNVMQGYLNPSAELTKCIQWNQPKPNLLGTNCCVHNRQVLGLYKFNWQRFPAQWLYTKFDLYKILAYSEFRLDRFHCTFQILRFRPPTKYKVSSIST